MQVKILKINCSKKYVCLNTAAILSQYQLMLFVFRKANEL